MPILACAHPSTPACCNDCAFAPGTEASKSQWTLLRVNLCLVAGVPFFCHAQGEPETVCAGFAAARAAQPPQPEWRKAFAKYLLDLQSRAESAPERARYLTDSLPVAVRLLEEKHLEEISEFIEANRSQPRDVR